MPWYKTAQSTPLPEEKWGFRKGDPVKFVDKNTGKAIVGIFVKAYMSPNFPAFPSKPMGMIYLGGDTTVNKFAPLEEIEKYDTRDIQKGDSVNLMIYPSESPAKVVAILSENKFEVLGSSMRRFHVPGYALIKNELV